MVVVPKSGFAMAASPLQCGFARSMIERGIEASSTRVVLTSRTRARAANPVQVPSAALKAAGIAAAFGDT